MQGKTTAQLRGSWHNFSKYRPLIRELVTRDLKVNTAAASSAMCGAS